MAKQYDVLFRLLLLGDSGVGKTCLLCRFTDNEFHPSHISTIGVDFKMKTLEIDGIKVRIQIWDTAGQERYQTITKQYYRRAQGIFLVYDITSERSFQHIMKWASDVDEYAPEKVQKILVGNKSDEEQKRQVATEQGDKLAKAYGMDFFETSAFTNHNITESFTRLAELVLQANKKDLDLLGGSINEELNLAVLEEQEGLYNGSDDTTIARFLQAKRSSRFAVTSSAAAARLAGANGAAAGVDTTIRCKISRVKRENSRNNGCTQPALRWRLLLRGGEQKLVSDFYRKVSWEKRPHESSERWRGKKKGATDVFFSEECSPVISQMPAFYPSSELRRLTDDLCSSPDYQRKTRIELKVATFLFIFDMLISAELLADPVSSSWLS
ncbi:unnamed protein product [Leuciscus chuanchicus]